MNTKKTATERHYEIITGPSKDTLFDACKYAYSEDTKIAVDFIVAIGYTMPKDDPGCACIPMAITEIKICGIEHESGSGESFNLHGSCKADLNSIGRRTNVVYEPYNFRAYYNSKSHKGTIAFS